MPKHHLWPVEAWTSVDPWRFALVSRTLTLAADPWSPVNCEVELPRLKLVCPAHPIYACSGNFFLKWSLNNLKQANAFPRITLPSAPHWLSVYPCPWLGVVVAGEEIAPRYTLGGKHASGSSVMLSAILFRETLSPDIKVDLASKFSKSQSNWASMGCDKETNLIHEGLTANLTANRT